MIAFHRAQAQAEIIKQLIAQHRHMQQRKGNRKLYLDIREDLKRHNIKMGRDGLFDFMREHRLLVPKTRRFHITTDSRLDSLSPNRIKGLTPTHAEQVWVKSIRT